MSRESVMEYLVNVGQDLAQQEVIKQAVEGKEDQTAAIVAAASERGYEFSADEFVEVIDALHRQQIGDLSDDELESVAGGRLAEPRLGSTKKNRLSLGRDLTWLGLKYS